MKQKFPDITVAVDKKRTRGIEKLTSGKYVEGINVILLDDAFQHRYVKPGINILLVDYHRLVIYDELLPSGRLREPVKSKDRADIVIVTKCPTDLKPMEFRVITKAMHLYPYQQLFFSTHEYDDLKPLFPNQENLGNPGSLNNLRGKNVLLLTGIASPEQMLQDLQSYTDNIQPLSFPDHHNFRKKDIERINDAFEALPSPKRIITTEKDASRLAGTEGLSDEVKQHLYVLPIHIKLLQDQEELFIKKILSYVRKDKRNSFVAKSKNDHMPNYSNSVGDRPRTISFRNS
jgi:tetraacyldisaccharide 4'-kinase